MNQFRHSASFVSLLAPLELAHVCRLFAIDNPQRQFSSNAEHVIELMTISQKLHGSQVGRKFKDMLQVHFVLPGCLLLVRFLVLFGHPVGSWDFAHCESG